MVDSFPLEAAPISCSKSFKCSEKDPAMYKEDLGFSPRKEWEESLPVSGTEPVPTVSAEHLKMALEVHHAQVRYLHNLGVDACKEFSQQRVDYILEAVVAGDLKCKVCGQTKKSTQSLRSHIRARHMEVTPFECKQCHKYFGDDATHKAHMTKHQPKSKMLPCDQCERVFLSQSRLTQHAKIHDPANIVNCQFCGKQFNAKKNCTTHEKSCNSRPGGRKAVSRDIKCQFCPKDYIHKKDYWYHLNTAHASQAHEVQL